MRFFATFETLNWTRMWWVVGIMTAFWASLAGITILFPVFDPWYKGINIVLGAVSAALLFAARGTKYIANRTEPPADGRP